MEKMTIRDLQCKLYIETLREEYNSRDFMFTTVGEEKFQRIIARIDTMDSEEVRTELCHRLIPLCKDGDFCLALLMSYWKAVFAGKSQLDVEEVDSLLIRELDLDVDRIDCQNVVEEYSSYLIQNESLQFFFKDVKNIILGKDACDGKDVLEIDTDFHDASDKIMTTQKDFLISKILQDLNGVKSKVVRYEDESVLSKDGKYIKVISQVSACPCLNAEGLITFFKRLASCANQNCGRIVLIDKERIIASDEMLSFRKMMIDENYLEIFISGCSFFADTYILYSSSQPESTKFNFVCGHQHSASIFDNLLTLHNKLSKSDVVSIDYNFNAATDLQSGQEGHAYQFQDLFFVPETGVKEVEVSGVYPTFQMKDFPYSFKGETKRSVDLERCEIRGTFKVVTENKLLFFVGDDKIRTCFIEASKESPVYVGKQFAVLELNTNVLLPKYVQILSAKGVFEKTFDDSFLIRKDFRCTDYVYDSYSKEEIETTPEEKICYRIHSMVQIPSKEQQGREIVDAQFLNASAVDRERALEMLLAEKTWLNEEHIRNIKHRIGNELLPVKNDVAVLSKLLERHSEGITLDTVHGKGEKVSELLSRLSRCVSKVNESLQDLTRTVEKGNLKPVDIVAAVKDFTKDVVNNNVFKLSLTTPDEHLNVNGSTNMINSILRNVVDNAVRHGFVDQTRNDYAIDISIKKDGNGNCVLEVKNNGTSMSEHARNSYFKRGSVAGVTGHSGIGGADVKDTVNAMGGEVTLPVDEDGWSVCVRVSLPILNSEKL